MEDPRRPRRLGRDILLAVKRKIFQETALKVTRVTAKFEEFHYMLTKYESDESDRDDGKLIVCTFQLNLCVEVEDTDGIRLNPDEHQRFDWCSLENIEHGFFAASKRQYLAYILGACRSFSSKL